MSNGNNIVRDTKKCRNTKCNKPVERKLYCKNCWNSLMDLSIAKIVKPLIMT